MMHKYFIHAKQLQIIASFWKVEFHKLVSIWLGLIFIILAFTLNYIKISI